MTNHANDETELPARSYFNVVDQDGAVHPAVEYWAATLAEDELPAVASRFVRLVGCNELLVSLGGSTFKGSRTARVYTRALLVAADSEDDVQSAEFTSLE